VEEGTLLGAKNSFVETVEERPFRPTRLFLNVEEGPSSAAKNSLVETVEERPFRPTRLFLNVEEGPSSARRTVSWVEERPFRAASGSYNRWGFSPG
jgi:hypothetical protein